MQEDDKSFNIYKPNPIQAVLCIAAIVATFWLFSSYGSDSDVALEPGSIFAWVKMQWLDEKFKNNWVMLLVSAYVIFRNRKALAEAETKPSICGILVVALSLAAHVLGYRTQLPRLSLGATVGVFWGIPYAIWGWNVARLLFFPAAYVFLCFCGSLLVEVTMPLRLMSSTLAVALLHGAGIEAVRQGTIVASAAGGGFQFDVADACSGLRSLIVTTGLAAPYAYFTVQGFWQRSFLFAMSIPLAMLANSLRIFSIGMVAEWIGMKYAMQLYHDLSGYLVFFLSLILLMGTGMLVQYDWKSKLCALKLKK